MYLIKSTDSFRSLVAEARLRNEDLTLKIGGLRAAPVATNPDLLRPEIKAVVKIYHTEADMRGCIEQQAKSRGKTLRLRPELGVVHLQGALPARGLVYVAIVVPPPSDVPSGGAAAAGSAPSERVQKMGDHQSFEVVVQKSAGEDQKVTLQIGDVLQLDEDERMEAIGGGIALILLNYHVVEEKPEQ